MDEPPRDQRRWAEWRWYTALHGRPGTLEEFGARNMAADGTRLGPRAYQVNGPPWIPHPGTPPGPPAGAPHPGTAPGPPVMDPNGWAHYTRVTAAVAEAHAATWRRGEAWAPERHQACQDVRERAAWADMRAVPAPQPGAPLPAPQPGAQLGAPLPGAAAVAALVPPDTERREVTWQRQPHGWAAWAPVAAPQDWQAHGWVAREPRGWHWHGHGGY